MTIRMTHPITIPPSFSSIYPETQVPKTSSILSVFCTQVERGPHYIAATYNHQQITYLELDQRSTQLARFILKNYQVVPNTPIAIMGSNKLEMLICELAILKAGAAFVPFEPNIPEERLAFTLKNAGVVLLITCDAASSKRTLSCEVINLFANKDRISTQSCEALADIQEAELAYILYTSGSTSSIPKGVMQTRNGLLGQIQNYTQDLKITHRDHFLQLAPLTHDQSVVDIYGALLNGATLHFVDMDLKTLNVQELRQQIVYHRISIFSSIPSVFSLIFEGVDNDYSFPHLRIITLGGEAVKTDHVKLYQKIGSPHCLFINGYGATEFSWISYFILKKDTLLNQMQQIPLGVLTSQTEMFLDFVDADSNQYMELCVHSPFMSPGYWNNPEATEKAFFQRQGKTYYRTGDLVFKDEDKMLHFNGRLNWHEKINGRRVNLKDVEEVMQQTLPLQECVVVAYGEGDYKKLYAFYTVKKGEMVPEDKTSIREKLTSFLKSHELPFKFYPLEAFPLLPNGKVHRQELKNKIEQEIQEIERNLNENKLVDQCFCEILQLNQPLADDCDYREAGMSSMDIVLFANKLNRKLEKSYGIQIRAKLDDILNCKKVSEVKEMYESKWTELREKRRRENRPLYFLHHPLIAGEKNKLYVDEEHRSLGFDFQGMKMLAEHYNQKYQIRIIPCESYERFINEIRAFIDRGTPGQIGLTWPKNGDKNGHPTPCICHINKERKISLYISDSLGKFPDDMKKEFERHNLNRQVQQYQTDPSDCFDIYVEPYQKQADINSCSSLAIAYLKEALRIDVSEVQTVSWDDFNEGIIAFENPPELLKYDQRLYPNVRYFNASEKSTYSRILDLTIPLKTSKNGRTLGQFWEKHVKENTYLEMPKKVGRQIQFTQNNAIYAKGKKFQKIIEDKIHANASLNISPSST